MGAGHPEGFEPPTLGSEVRFSQSAAARGRPLTNLNPTQEALFSPPAVAVVRPGWRQRWRQLSAHLSSRPFRSNFVVHTEQLFVLVNEVVSVERRKEGK